MKNSYDPFIAGIAESLYSWAAVASPSPDWLTLPLLVRAMYTVEEWAALQVLSRNPRFMDRIVRSTGTARIRLPESSHVRLPNAAILDEIRVAHTSAVPFVAGLEVIDLQSFPARIQEELTVWFAARAACLLEAHHLIDRVRELIACKLPPKQMYAAWPELYSFYTPSMTSRVRGDKVRLSSASKRKLGSMLSLLEDETTVRFNTILAASVLAKSVVSEREQLIKIA